MTLEGEYGSLKVRSTKSLYESTKTSSMKPIAQSRFKSRTSA